jgi:membrane-associated protease RseP (regulator of RpoE activity)
MTTSMVRFLWMGFALLFFLPGTYAQYCVTCHDGSAKQGWVTSPGLDCSVRNCYPGAQNTPFQASLHPGFFTTQSHGQITVSGVIPGSPADQVGIHPGDIILRINGNALGATCPSLGWESSPGSRRAEIVIRRNDSERILSTSLVPVESLVASQWTRNGSFLEPVTTNSAVSKGSSMLSGSHLIGVKFKAAFEVVIVDDVLKGSPAASADIQPGDRLVEIEGDTPRFSGIADINNRTLGDRRFEIKLLLQRGSSIRSVTLQAEGLSEILRNATRSTSNGAKTLEARAD